MCGPLFLSTFIGLTVWASSRPPLLPIQPRLTTARVAALCHPILPRSYLISLRRLQRRVGSPVRRLSLPTTAPPRSSPIAAAWVLLPRTRSSSPLLSQGRIHGVEPPKRRPATNPSSVRGRRPSAVRLLPTRLSGPVFDSPPAGTGNVARSGPTRRRVAGEQQLELEASEEDGPPPHAGLLALLRLQRRPPANLPNVCTKTLSSTPTG